MDNSVTYNTKLIKKMYKKNLEKIIALNRLEYEVKQDGSFVLDENNIVVGGSCIDRCDGKIENLAINFYLDILMPINYAALTSSKCAIYIDTPIEEINSSIEMEKWLAFAEKTEKFLKRISKCIGLNIQTIRRDKSYPLLDNLLKKYTFRDSELKGLYDLVPSSKNVEFSPSLLLHFRRSIVSYLPEFISMYYGKKIDKVIVVEELSQCKAIEKAKEISGSIIPKIYIDMPSVSCNNRMHRSENGKIGIFEKNITKFSNQLFIEFINSIKLSYIYSCFKVDNFWALKDKLEDLWHE